MTGYRKHPHLLEINAFLFLRRLREKYGKDLTLGEIPSQEWQQIADQGFDFVWMMGVWRRSEGARQCALEEITGWKPEDIAGSPYAVADYSLDPFLGNPADLEKLKKSLNHYGLGLILDYVPNHLALDHKRTVTNPECFVQTAPGVFAQGKDPHFPLWMDTVQINFFSTQARQMALQDLKRIAKWADGVRCDMAMLGLSRIFEKTWGKFSKGPRPPQEFWKEIISLIRKKFPGFLFMAEAYWDTEWELQQLDFDFTYDKRLYDRLLNGPASEIKAHLKAGLDFQNKCVRFIENHDEKRAMEVFGREKSYAAAAMIATLPGLRFFHDGQFQGKKIFVPVQIVREPAETADPVTENFYRKLFALTAEPIFHEGRWQLHETTSENLLCWSWQLGQEIRLVVINYSDHPVQGKIRFPETWQEEELAVDLEPWEAHNRTKQTEGLWKK